jgi:16S rRNA (adenine1518-N6/adenine1519-N6)-dimethyltransferase
MPTHRRAKGAADARPRARKRFGQHFLEPVWAAKVIAAIGPRPDQTFVEIGPGPGAMTRMLAASAARVVAFEIDRDMVAHLRGVAIPRVNLVEGDFLEVTPASVLAALSDAGHPDGDPIHVAGNLPYNVASPILVKLIDLAAAGVPLVSAAVMLQREVANRLLAEPGTKDYGVLTAIVRHSARVDRLLQLPAGAFRPAPKVQSSVVRLTFHAPEPAALDVTAFRALTQSLFSRRRKTSSNALLAYSAAATYGPAKLLAEAGIDPQRRPETLSIAELVGLSNRLTSG